MREILRRVPIDDSTIEGRLLIERIGEHTFLVGGFAERGAPVGVDLMYPVRTMLRDRTGDAFGRAMDEMTARIEKEIAKWLAH
jgi:hypothetical protein